VTDHYHETGAVRRLSVAVLVDGEYTGNGEERSYEPRSDEELAQMSRLVKSAIGFDESRGDTVEIVNMPFKQLSTDWGEEQIEPIFGLAKQDYFRIAEILVLSIVALLVIMLVVRPLVARTLEALPKPQDVQKAAERLISDSSGGPRPALPPGMEAPAPGMDGGEASLPLADAPESLINLEQVEGRVRASSIKKVGEIVKKHPEESVSILRNWMYQEG
jgi:flagellar M-ring protein FliF